MVMIFGRSLGMSFLNSVSVAQSNWGFVSIPARGRFHFSLSFVEIMHFCARLDVATNFPIFVIWKIISEGLVT